MGIQRSWLVSGMSPKIANKAQTLWKKFSNKEYRDAFSEQHLYSKICTQIYLLRKAKGWSQSELAKAAGMRQSQISKLENPDNSQLSIATLQKIAVALDVSVNLAFVSHSDLLDDALNEDEASLTPYSFDEDNFIVGGLDSHLTFVVSDQCGEQVIVPSNDEGGPCGLPEVLRAV